MDRSDNKGDGSYNSSVYSQKYDESSKSHNRGRKVSNRIIKVDDSVLPLGFSNEVTYTARDKEELTHIKQDIDQNKTGKKRGRKVQNFSEYCEQTT